LYSSVQVARAGWLAADEAREQGVHSRLAPGAALLHCTHAHATLAFAPSDLTCVLASSPARQAIFATQVFPPAPHFAPGTPLALGVAATFGPWTVRCDAVDALDAEGRSLLAAPALSMWDVLTGDFCYHLPLLPVDEAASALAAATLAADADGAAAGAAAPAPSLGLRIALAPVMPPVRGMAHDLRAALPLVVSGCDGDEPEQDGDGAAAAAPADTQDGCADEEGAAAHDSDVAAGGAGGGGGAPRIYVVRGWCAAALAAPRCVRVRITYTRPKRTAAESDAAAPA
jgi:hypothetical protein